MNDKELEIDKIGSKNAPIKITLKTYKGNEIIDIRKFYSDKDGNLKPTRKGISLTRRKVYPLLKSLAKNIDQINSFFEENRDENLFADKISDLESRDIIISEIERHKFFKVNHLGGKDDIIINNEHPFGSYLENLKNELSQIDESLSDKLETLINVLLLTYSKTNSYFGDEEELEVGTFIEDQEINWGRYLKKELNGF